MPDQPNELGSLLSQARAGDNDAIRKVVNTYRSIIWREVQGHLGQHLRTQFDSTDILQEVWMDFFSKRTQRQTFQAEAELTRYLAGMSRNVVIELRRRHLYTQKRDLRRQIPLDSSPVSADSDLVDWRPGPEERATDEEQWNQLFKRLEPRARWALVMLRSGYSQHEVAEMLGVNGRIVRRILERSCGR